MQATTGPSGTPGPLSQNDLLFPEWPAPKAVKAVFTTRRGGVSRAPFSSMNLGTHVRDEASAVAENRERLQAWLQAEGARRAVFLDQVHGTVVEPLRRTTADGCCADAALATQPGLVCTVMVADCLPILLTTRTGRAVVAVHAGWRGLAGVQGQGVLERAVAALREAEAERTPGEPAPHILAWLGPCIGPRRFEVGFEVREAFGTAGQACFHPLPAAGKLLADLPGLARLRLGALGVTGIYGNDGGDAWCTVMQDALYFSHRRDAARLGSTGRMAACIWIDETGSGLAGRHGTGGTRSS